MDPERRPFLQRTIEDWAKTDQMFMILVEDLVEPRRVLIQRHPSEVKIFDISEI
jgi:DNA gyrase/topoisomerase IV subunit B